MDANADYAPIAQGGIQSFPQGAPAPSSQPTINTELAGLEAELDRLRGDWHQLMAALEPVLRPATPSDVPNTPEDRGSEVASRVHSARRQIIDLRDAICDVTGRVDL